MLLIKWSLIDSKGYEKMQTLLTQRLPQVNKIFFGVTELKACLPKNMKFVYHNRFFFIEKLL